MVSTLTLSLAILFGVQTGGEAWRIYLDGLQERSEVSVTLESGETVNGLLSGVEDDSFGVWVEASGREDYRYVRRKIQFSNVDWIFSPDAEAEDVGARAPARRFSELPGRVRVGDRVRIRFHDGTTLDGTLGDISWERETLVVARGPDAFELPGTDIMTVDLRVKDSLWNGFGIGFAAGAVLTAIPCSQFCRGGEFVAAGTFYGLVGGGLGALVDSLISSRRTVYTAAAPETLPEFALVPVIRRDGAGLAFSLYF